MKAIDKYMAPLSESLQENINELNRIKSILQLTCVYSPDHEQGGIYDKHVDKLREVFTSTVDLGAYLDKIFFDQFYIYRPEETNILDILGGGNYLQFVTGLVGVGKTVVLQKIKNDFEQDKESIFVYLNLRKEISRFENLKEVQFQDAVRGWIFSEIKNRLTKAQYLDWLDYRILKDIQFEGLRTAYEIATRDRVKDIEDIRRIREYEKFEDHIIGSIKSISPDLDVLLEYINVTKRPIILCIDNIDRRTYQEQRIIVSLCDAIVQEFGIPVIIAIRKTSIRAIMFETRKARGDRSDLSSVYFFEPMAKVVPGNEKTVNFEELHQSSIRNMIKRRIEFLQSNQILGTLEGLRLEYLKKHDMTQERFDREFWEIFEDITGEFVDRGMYEYSNYNIREMFAQYVGFVSTLLFNPEESYQWEKFLLTGRYIDRTKLRTFLIKWQINNGNIDPRGSSEKIINIYDEKVVGISLLSLRILNYISNFEKKPSNGVLRFGDLAEDFGLLSVKESDLKNHLLKLCKSRGAHELGLLWIDSEKTEIIEGDSIIELNPAGKYFLNRFSNTREYAFWCAISANLVNANNSDIDIVKRYFSLDDTYKDSFKLDVVYNFINDYLLHWFTKDIGYIMENLNLPTQYKGNKLDFFEEKFTRENRFYIMHLILNVRATIDDDGANLDEKERDHYRTKYQKLLEKYINLESDLKIC